MKAIKPSRIKNLIASFFIIIERMFECTKMAINTLLFKTNVMHLFGFLKVRTKCKETV